MGFDQDQYALSVDVDKAFGLETQLRPRALLAESPQLLDAAHHGPVRVHRREIELGLRCDPFGPGSEQRAWRLVALADRLHVLLRHRLRSISQQAREGARLTPKLSPDQDLPHAERARAGPPPARRCWLRRGRTGRRRNSLLRSAAARPGCRPPMG